MEIDRMDQMFVYLRDLRTNTWSHYPAADWIDQYAVRIKAALDVHASTLGGTLLLSGTPECGRVTVRDRETRETIIDSDWHTLTLAQALGQSDVTHGA